MGYVVLCEQFGYDAINEMRSFVTDKGSRGPKSREDVYLQELTDYNCITLQESEWINTLYS